MTNPMNNPAFQMINAMRRGANPAAFMQQMASRDPAVRQLMQMINGKNPDQLRQMAENMARERGTTVQDVAKSLGINL